MVSQFLLLGCNLSYIVDLFAWACISYRAHITKARIIGARAVKTLWRHLKDVRAHCCCASLLRPLFIKHARATSFSSARTESKTQQNIELMTLALTWCANIFVGCSTGSTQSCWVGRERKLRNENNEQFTFVSSSHLFHLTLFYWENRCLQILRNTVALN